MTVPAKLTFNIIGMGCDGCVAAIENVVIPMAGVAYVGVSLSGRTMTVRPGAGFDRDAVLSRVRALGYDVEDGTADERAPSPGCRCRSQHQMKA